MRLYDLTDQYTSLLELLENDPDNEQLQQMINGLEGAIEEKVENICKVIRMLEGQAKVIGDEIVRLQQRKTTVENNIRRLKESTQQLLTDAGLERIKGKLFNVWIQSNPPSVNVVDETQIPERFFHTQKVLQKKDILEAAKAGQEVPGVEIVQGRGLRIR